LRFISLPLRRTESTPRDAKFARLDLGLFTKSSLRMTFCEFIIIEMVILPPGSAASCISGFVAFDNKI
jgi:hypothetical protein